jgi:hypothetical protein
VSHHTESFERLNKALGLAKGTPLSEPDGARQALQSTREELAFTAFERLFAQRGFTRRSGKRMRAQL